MKKRFLFLSLSLAIALAADVSFAKPKFEVESINLAVQVYSSLQHTAMIGDTLLISDGAKDRILVLKRVEGGPFQVVQELGFNVNGYSVKIVPVDELSFFVISGTTGFFGFKRPTTAAPFQRLHSFPARNSETTMLSSEFFLTSREWDDPKKNGSLYPGFTFDLFRLGQQPNQATKIYSTTKRNGSFTSRRLNSKSIAIFSQRTFSSNDVADTSEVITVLPDGKIRSTPLPGSSLSLTPLSEDRFLVYTHNWYGGGNGDLRVVTVTSQGDLSEQKFELKYDKFRFVQRISDHSFIQAQLGSHLSDTECSFTVRTFNFIKKSGQFVDSEPVRLDQTLCPFAKRSRQKSIAFLDDEEFVISGTDNTFFIAKLDKPDRSVGTFEYSEIPMFMSSFIRPVEIVMDRNSIVLWSAFGTAPGHCTPESQDCGGEMKWLLRKPGGKFSVAYTVKQAGDFEKVERLSDKAVLVFYEKRIDLITHSGGL